MINKINRKTDADKGWTKKFFGTEHRFSLACDFMIDKSYIKHKITAHLQSLCMDMTEKFKHYFTLKSVHFRYFQAHRHPLFFTTNRNSYITRFEQYKSFVWKVNNEPVYHSGKIMTKMTYKLDIQNLKIPKNSYNKSHIRMSPNNKPYMISKVYTIENGMPDEMLYRCQNHIMKNLFKPENFNSKKNRYDISYITKINFQTFDNNGNRKPYKFNINNFE